ncbi:hypothetical protein K3Z97_25630, partial [Pseudomonas aeruginosa]|nr:hypothetical protein [Pseudomonas aeruginosa]
MSFPLRPLTRWLLPPPACLLLEQGDC